MGKIKPPRATASRLPFVEGMRGIAALYVVLGHLCSMSDPSYLADKASKAPVWFQRLTAPFDYGHLAVAAFIVISGFCLQLSLFSSGEGQIKSLRRFFVRRARRILPAYYGCLIISTLVAIFVTSRLPGMPFGLYLPVTPTNVLAHVFLVHNFSPAWMYKLNGVLWSIAIEAQLYIVFPLIVASLFRIGRWWTLVLSSLAALTIVLLAPDGMKLYSWFLPLFVMGMISAHLAYRPHPRMGLTYVGARALAWTCAALCLVGLSKKWELPFTDVSAGTVVACICYVGAIAKSSAAVKFFSLKPLIGLGAFSYSLYLIHHPIQQVLFWLKPSAIGGSVGSFAYLFATLPVIVFCAWAFSLLFERPFMSASKASAGPLDRFVPTSLPLQTIEAKVRRKAAPRSNRPTAPGDPIRVAAPRAS